MSKLLLLTVVFILNVSAFSLFEEKPSPTHERIVYLDSLKDLIVATQKTRGLTNNFMNGNVVAQLLIYNERSEMKKALARLKSQKLVVDATTQQEIAILQKELKHLNKKAFKQQSAEVFQNYTKLIQKMLTVGDTISQTTFSQSDTLTQKSVQLMMGTILPLTEEIGKTRGMGSGIVARGNALKEENIYMKNYVARAEYFMQQLLNETQTITQNQPNYYPAGVMAKVQQLNTKVEAYLTLTQSKVINQKEIELDTNKYFDQGTALISSAVAIYTINKDTLSK